ncbi:glycosyltransferase family 8 protein [Nocardia asiatica]|uniref:glycosyltransferase family 8 protein n=1 Tax=Nocardia asiatica TaxID=209252 RepID=UPI003EE3FD30
MPVSASEASLAPIVCCFDYRYVLPFCVLLESLAESHVGLVDELQVFAVHEDLPPSAMARIDAHATRLGIRVDFRRTEPVDNRFPTDGPQPGQFTRAVYLRLMLGNVLSDVRRVLYLDADLIVLRDLRALLSLPLNGRALGAVRDPIQPTLEQGYALPGWRDEGIPGDREYFNSGVLLFDLDECRKQKFFERAVSFLEKFPERAACLDQDALNWVANDAWIRLDSQWNTINSQTFIWYFGMDIVADPSSAGAVDLLLQQESEASILHYAGRQKPWHDDCPESNSRALYHRFLNYVLENEN